MYNKIMNDKLIMQCTVIFCLVGENPRWRPDHSILSCPPIYFIQNLSYNSNFKIFLLLDFISIVGFSLKVSELTEYVVKRA
jgi:hypothetical protein